ncbi:uncharacterized protein N7518_001409 [Penicillium psychrosexuale]|uniref:uncharacterized protein n=1 Tax=Penicillium psychrosexuale TaxID=1002107 RepID=UPI0025451B39|nr:uncharacterized protein N7518_001409 [Penicillium psychrosexuale]KAJ5799341.1 hypothetical protein N7518_001409 [Penicillium psychrosexuale]
MEQWDVEGVKGGSKPKKRTTGGLANERTKERGNENERTRDDGRWTRDEGCKRRKNRLWK